MGFHNMGTCYSVNHDVIGDEMDIDNACDEHGGDRVMLKGSSRFVSMYTKKGTKGTNQDALTVWENFAGEKDTIFCGVFDGHGPLGENFSQCVRDNLPSKISTAIKMSQDKICKNNVDGEGTSSEHNDKHLPFASWWEENFSGSFNEMDKYLATNVDTDGFCGGSTAVTLVKQGDQLIVGNLGDSRAILCTRDNDNQLVPVPLTVDLKPKLPSEASRILSCGGRVFAAETDPDVTRIWMPEGDCPGLAMSRAFGDFCLKDYGLSSVPDVSCRKLTNHDEFIVLASDGIWEALTNNEVINIVASAPKRSSAAKLLVKRAVNSWKHNYPFYHVDDCTAICLFLKDEPVDEKGNNSLHKKILSFKWS